MSDKKFDKLITEIGELSVGELAELVHEMEEKFGISAAAPVAAGGGGDAGEEKTEFDVVLKAAGDQKLNVIKAIRVILPELGLKEAKDLVEGAPKTVKEGMKKEEAEEAKTKLEEAGATAVLE